MSTRAARRSRGKREQRRLSEVRVRKMVDLCAEGYSLPTIAKATRTPEQLVCSILGTVAHHLVEGTPNGAAAPNDEGVGDDV